MSTFLTNDADLSAAEIAADFVSSLPARLRLMIAVNAFGIARFLRWVLRSVLS
jgi:hypothetical protein